MEFKVYKDTVTAAENICDTKTELPIETELLIPDYLPQVFKIVKCFVHLVVLQKQILAGRITIDGYLRCVVYYQSDSDESLCQTEQKLPFTKQMELKAGDYHNALAQVTGETEYINCRAVNQRRVDIRGAYVLNISVSAQAEQEIITALSDGGVEQKSQLLQSTQMVAAQDKLITAEENIAFDAQPEMILGNACEGVVDEVKLISGKAVVKGSIHADISYRTDPGHDVLHAIREIPFNEIVELEGADENCESFVFLEPTGCTILAGSSEEESGNTISVTAMLQLKVYKPVEYYAVCDAFSTQYITELSMKEIMMETVVDRFTQTVEITATGQMPDENAQIVEVLATPLPVEMIDVEGEAALRGRAVAHMICINALGEIDCYDKTCEYTLPQHYAGGPADLTACCYASINSVAVRKSGAEASVSIGLTVHGMIKSRARTSVLESVTATDPVSPADEDIALRIYYAEPGEDIFDIAKRYAASPVAIASANGVEEGVLPTKMQLLIPSSI